MVQKQSTSNPNELAKEFKKIVKNDPVELAERLYRVRNNQGQLVDYIMTEPHKEIMRAGLLGDKTAMYRIINKGRQLGFSIYQAVESSLIASIMPNTYQYYIATKEQQAKSWLRKVERISKDARLWIDGSRIIDVDSVHSSLLEKVFKHPTTELKREIEESYITGLAASPAGIQGETAISIILDEFAWMIQRKNQQSDIYEAVKYFISQGGQLTIQSTPVVTSDTFWKIYKNAEKLMFKKFYCPTITNWESLNLGKDLREQHCVIPYPWVDINVLEKARRNDVTYFKQMNLGIPADVRYRFLDPDIVHSRCIAQEEYYGERGYYGMAVDVAQDRDITAITVGKLDGDIVKEVFIDESQEDYTVQAQKVETIAMRYPGLMWIALDTTGGHGRGIHDILKYKVSVPLTKLDYSTKIKIRDRIKKGNKEEWKKERIGVFMATQFNAALLNNKYQMLDHSQAVQHCLNVEKLTTPTGERRFSGKKNGRDDYFWSKAMLNHGFKGHSTSVTLSAYSKATPSVNIPPQQNRSHHGFLVF